MKIKTSTALKFLVCGLLVFMTATLQAQLLKYIQFSAAEGYTNGPLLGQPAHSGSVWTNVSGAVQNSMESYTNADGTPWIIATVTNGNLLIYPDENFGTNTSVNYWAIPFPVQFSGPITVTWDWRFYPTNGTYPFGPNVIPADYDPTNNNYNSTCSQPSWNAASWYALAGGTASWYNVPWYPGIITNSDGTLSTNEVLRGTDHGFTLADSANRNFSGNFNADGSPAAVFNCLCTPNRISSQSDARYNGNGYEDYTECGGSGNWNNCSNDFGPPGPEFKDGKLIHHKMIAYFGNPSSATNNSFDVWAQRDGEEVWQETVNDLFPTGPYPMRRCPNEWNSENGLPQSGIDCITLWLNTGALSTHIALSNIVVLGPIPVVTAQASGANVTVTFSGTLQSANAVEGPYSDVVGQSTDVMVALKTWAAPNSPKQQFYRSRQ